MSIIILSFFLINCYGKSDSLTILCLSILICVSILFIFNFFTGKILTGDGGAYFLGFIIGAISIEMCNSNILSATNIAYIICYPIIEVCFSFFRRLINKNKNSFEPDSLHIHQLIYYLLINKFKSSNLGEFTLNSLSSLVILVPFLTLIIIAESLKDSINSFYILMAFVLIYILTYQKLFNMKESVG